MKKLLSLTATILILISGCATHNIKPTAHWQLMFHHDASGKAIVGDKQKLIDAVTNARPIRIVWPIRENFIHVADAGFLTVMNGEVFAQINGIIRQIPNQESRRSIALDAESQSRWHSIVATTGEIQAFQSKEKKLNSRQRAFKWYAYSR